MIAMAYMNWGRWVADCPREECPNAEHFGAAPVTGHVGGLTDCAFRCGFCTLECPALWPPDRALIETILGERPVPSTRNWRPGEPARGLVDENITRGITTIGA